MRDVGWGLWMRHEVFIRVVQIDISNSIPRYFCTCQLVCQASWQLQTEPAQARFSGVFSPAVSGGNQENQGKSGKLQIIPLEWGSICGKIKETKGTIKAVRELASANGYKNQLGTGI